MLWIIAFIPIEDLILRPMLNTNVNYSAQPENLLTIVRAEGQRLIVISLSKNFARHSIVVVLIANCKRNWNFTTLSLIVSIFTVTSNLHCTNLFVSSTENSDYYIKTAQEMLHVEFQSNKLKLKQSC